MLSIIYVIWHIKNLCWCFSLKTSFQPTWMFLSAHLLGRTVFLFLRSLITLNSSTMYYVNIWLCSVVHFLPSFFRFHFCHFRFGYVFFKFLSNIFYVYVIYTWLYVSYSTTTNVCHLHLFFRCRRQLCLFFCSLINVWYKRKNIKIYWLHTFWCTTTSLFIFI